MGYDGIGRIYIPAEDFWKFVMSYVESGSAEIAFGKDLQFVDGELVIKYAMSTSDYPTQWVRPPDFLVARKAVCTECAASLTEEEMKHLPRDDMGDVLWMMCSNCVKRLSEVMVHGS